MLNSLGEPIRDRPRAGRGWVIGAEGQLYAKTTITEERTVGA